MGAADIVPGVSGGTIAFITGIYEELIESINALNFGALKVWKKEGFLSEVSGQSQPNILSRRLCGQYPPNSKKAEHLI